MYLYDYHMHSVNSRDGKNTIPDMCTKAIAAGINEIAITDHFEPMSGSKNCPEYKPERYFLDILKARYIFGREVRIKAAVELGQPHIYPEHSQKLIDSYPYDYVLSSVHKMKDDMDFGDIVYTLENVSYYCVKYLEELKLLARWNQFDCIGHLDLVKRYASQYNVKADLMNHKDRLEEILKIIIQNGKGIEVNTSGLRQSAKECMPALSIVSLYRQLGGEIITVGSDAHNAADVGKGIIEAIEIIKLAGFDFLTVYTNRKPSMIRISDKPSIYQLNKQTA